MTTDTPATHFAPNSVGGHPIPKTDSLSAEAKRERWNRFREIIAPLAQPFDTLPDECWYLFGNAIGHRNIRGESLYPLTSINVTYLQPDEIRAEFDASPQCVLMNPNLVDGGLKEKLDELQMRELRSLWGYDPNPPSLMDIARSRGLAERRDEAAEAEPAENSL